MKESFDILMNLEQYIDLSESFADDEGVFSDDNDKNNDDRDLEGIIKEQEKQIAEKDDQIVRLTADMRNMSKRHEKVIEDMQEYAISEFALDIVSVMDSLEKAMENADKDLNSLKDGVEAIIREFSYILTRHNITKIESTGEEFDMQYHEAVKTETISDKANGVVLETLRSGYKIGRCDKNLQRCLRHAMVVVNRLS